MRVALSVVCLSAALLAPALAGGCSGGASTTDPLNTREPAPSGMDPSPMNGYESPTSTYESPPSGYETPPSMGDPANQAGGSSKGGSCPTCGGTYSCVNEDGGTGDYALVLIASVCYVTADKTPVATIAGCGGSTAGAGVLPAYTIVTGGGTTACPEGSGGSCQMCTLIVDAGGGKGGSGSSGGDSCSKLSSCCANAGPEESACNEVVSNGNEALCMGALSLCGGS